MAYARRQAGRGKGGRVGGREDELLDDTPDEIHRAFFNARFTAEYTKCMFVPTLGTYRHCLHIAEDSPIVKNLATLLPKYDLEEDSTVKVCLTGGIDLLITLDAEEPLGVHDWQIYDCQIYQEPRYLLLSVRRIHSTQLNDADKLNATSVSSVWSGISEFFRMTALVVCVFFVAVTQITQGLVRLTEVILKHVPIIINSLMPLCIAIVQALTKCVGGLYLLIALLFNRNVPQMSPSNFAIEGRRRSRTPEPSPRLMYADNARAPVWQSRMEGQNRKRRTP